jgi:hypothetical protein
MMSDEGWRSERRGKVEEKGRAGGNKEQQEEDNMKARGERDRYRWQRVARGDKREARRGREGKRRSRLEGARRGQGKTTKEARVHKKLKGGSQKEDEGVGKGWVSACAN